MRGQSSPRWPLGRWPLPVVVVVVILLVILACHHCKPLPVIGDFPIVAQSSRGPVPVSLPLPVVAVEAPSRLHRMPAKPERHRGLLPAIPKHRRRFVLRFRCLRRYLG
jgi:hypothetical protein